jgi:hypothetical protein
MQIESVFSRLFLHFGFETDGQSQREKAEEELSYLDVEK